VTGLSDPGALVQGVLAGDVRAVARAISLVEDGDPAAETVIRELYPHTGRAHTIGVTGPPGAGKSTLVSALTRQARERGQTVGVVSVDPSSPFTQGALLGDRIRLADHFLDEDVFIRSMSARGHAGGLAETTLLAALILDAAGKQLVFVETVGAGQSDVGVLGVADTVLLVLQPGSGDSIQALKAGIMEIPDAIAISRGSEPQAAALLRDVRRTLGLEPDEARRPPVLLTEAPRGEGVAELLEVLGAHRANLEAAGELAERRRRNLVQEVLAVASARTRKRLEAAVWNDPDLRPLLDAVAARKLDPLTAVNEILEKVLNVARQNGPDAH
jgi:LAO/AO transport system kinase